MKTYRLATIRSGIQAWGIQAHWNPIISQSPDTAFIIFGKAGRTNSLAIIPVKVTAAQQEELQKNGSVLIEYAAISQTQQGLPMLISSGGASGNALIALFETKIGSRGNDQTGDWNPQVLPSADQLARASITVLKPFLPFPGTEIARGIFDVIDDDEIYTAAHLLALIPPEVWFSDVCNSDKPEESVRYYYYWGQDTLRVMTWDERVRRGFISAEQLRAVSEKMISIPERLLVQLVEECANSALMGAVKRYLET